MTASEIVDAVLVGLDIIINWPVAILVVVLLFRKQIEQLFGVLGERLWRISVGNTTMEFESAQREYLPELQDINRESIPQSVRSQGETYWDEDEIDQNTTTLDVDDEETTTSLETDEDDTTTSELEKELDELRRRLDDMKQG